MVAQTSTMAGSKRSSVELRTFGQLCASTLAATRLLRKAAKDGTIRATNLANYFRYQEDTEV